MLNHHVDSQPLNPMLTIGKSFSESACQAVPHAVLRVQNVDALFYATLTSFLQATAEMSCHDTMLSVSKYETQLCP